MESKKTKFKILFFIGKVNAYKYGNVPFLPKIIVATVASALANFGFTQTVADSRPISGTLKCEKVIIPQNDSVLVNIFSDPKVVEQGSDDEVYNKWAEDFTKQKLLKEKKIKKQQKNDSDNSLKTSLNTIPILGKNFKGNSFSGYTPSDCGFAISNSGYIVSAVNGSVNFYNTNGTVILSSTLLNFMKESSGSLAADPRVIYDPVFNKFIFCAIGGITAYQKAIILFSTSDDPTKAWNKYTLTLPDIGGTSTDELDYPSIGITENELFLGITITGSNKFPIIQINKKSGYAGTTLNYNTWIDQASQPLDCTIPVTKGQQGDSYGNDAYFLQLNRTGSSTIYLFKVSDTIGAFPTLTEYPLPTEAYAPAGYVAQLGSATTLKTSNCRPMSAVIVNGIIHYVFHLDYDNTGYYGIRYGRIDVNNSNAHTISHIHNSTNQIDLCFPSVASIGSSPNDKSVLIYLMTSGSSIYPGIKAYVCDDQMNWSAPITIKNGTGPIAGSRWGDYTCSSRKHNGQETVWASGQYGKSGTSYEMWISEILISNPNMTTEMTEETPKNTIFPNPTIDLFYLQFFSQKDQQVKIDVLDIQGKEVKSLYDAPVIHGINTLSFNKGVLGNGIYIIRILSSANQIILEEKLVVSSH